MDKNDNGGAVLKRKPRGRRTGRLAAAGVLLVVVAGAATAAAYFSWREARVAELASRAVPAARRLFYTAVRVKGVVRPAAAQTLYTAVSGVVSYTAEHGAAIKAGETAVELDRRPFEDRLAAQEEDLRRLKARRELARQEEIKERAEAEGEARQRNLQLKLAEARLAELRNGPEPDELLVARNAILSAERIMAARRRELEAVEDLSKLGLISGEELRTRRLGVELQQVAVEKKKLALKRLQKPDPLKTAELELAVRDARRACRTIKERLVRLTENERRSREAHARNLRRAEMGLALRRRDIAACLVKAPAAGVLLVGRQRWGGGRLQAGCRVRRGMKLAEISSLQQMKVTFAVGEGSIEALRRGQKVLVRTTDRPPRVYEGTVTVKAVRGRDEFEKFAKETRDVVGEAKRTVFDVEAELHGETPGLFPGRSVEVEIRLLELPDAVVVPAAALRRTETADTGATAPGKESRRPEEHPEAVVLVYDADKGIVTRRKVLVRAENGLYAAVKGLREGERVLPP